MKHFTQGDSDNIALSLVRVARVTMMNEDLIEATPDLVQNHAIMVHLFLADWISHVMPELGMLHSNPQEALEAARQAEQDVVASRGRLSGAYSEERPSRLIELLGGVEVFGRAVVRWAEDPLSCVAELDQGIDGLLRAIYRFDPSAYDNCVAGTLVTSPSPGKIVFKL